jgi:protein SCO1/2
MSVRVWSSFALVLLGCGCSHAPEGRQYELKGQILAIKPAQNEVLIKHEDIKGFMPAMTMPYKVQDPALLADKQPGDLVTATLVVADVEAHLSTLSKTGHAALDVPPPAPTISAFDMVKEGEEVPDRRLVDETGTPRPLRSLRGHRVALTFMYTRCPLPEYCPLMDRNFVSVQNTIQQSPDLADVQLVSVSFDPDYDTPAVLQQHARNLHANPRIWHFVTADRDDLTSFAARFGVTVERDAGNGAITHSLRTAVIDPEGRLVKAYSGNSWTPAELVADLKATPAPAH